MAINRPVVSVGLDAAPVQQFMEEYKKFQGWIAKTPEAFKKTNSQVKELEKMFRTVSQSFSGVADGIKQSNSYLTKLNQLAAGATTQFINLERRVVSASRSILGMTRSLMGWSGLSIAAGGILSGLGMEHLASSMHRTRMQTLGTGVSYANQKAFELTYGRQIGGGADVLSSIAAAKMQPGSEEYANLYSIVGKDAMQGSTEDIAKALLRRTRELYKSGQHIAYGDVLAGAGMTTERVRAIGSMSDEEFGKYEKQYGDYAKKFTISDETLRRFQKFDEALEAAGVKIKSAFVTALDPLVGEGGALNKLAETFSDVVQKIIGSEGFAWVIEKVRTGLSAFADWIRSDNFKDDMKQFMKTIRETAGTLAQLGSVIGSILDFFRKAPSFLPQSVQDFLNMTPSEAWKKFVGGSGPQSVTVTPNDATRAQMAAQGLLPGGVTADEATRLKAAISKIEGNYSSLGPIANASGDRAYGKYQVMGANIPAWTKEFLGKEMTPQEFLADHGAQDAVFMGKMTQYRNKHGSWEAAARAWFAGEGGMNDPNRKDVLGTTVEKYGRMFAEYYGEGAYGGGQRQNINVTINNNTPNQVTAQVGAAAPVSNPSANAPLQVGNPIPPPSSYARVASQ